MLVDIWVIAAATAAADAVAQDGSVLVEQHDGKGVFLM
jgi:hypothetical protein